MLIILLLIQVCSFCFSFRTIKKNESLQLYKAIRNELKQQTVSEEKLKKCLFKLIEEDPDYREINFILGNLYLFGYSKANMKQFLIENVEKEDFTKNLTSFECNVNLSNYDEPNGFPVNLTLAIEYLISSHKEGHPNAAPLVYILIKYKSLFNFDFSFLFRIQEEHWYLNKILLESSNRNGILSKMIMYSELFVCNSLKAEKKVKDLNFYDIQFLLDEELANIYELFFEYFEEDSCWNCKDSTYFGLEIASNGLEKMQKKGGETQPPKRFDELADTEIVKSQVNISEAYEFIKQSADFGAMRSQVAVGELNLIGDHTHGIEPNPLEAQRYLEMASNQGSLDSLHALGIMNVHGIGVEQNFTKAREYLEEASRKGNVKSHGGLAYLYINGQGVEQNYSKAAELLEKAIEAGDMEALANLAAIYHRGGDNFPRNASKAFELFIKAMKKKQLSSMFNIVLLTLTDPEIKHNFTCVDIMGILLEVIVRTDAFDIQKKAYELFLAQEYHSSLIFSLLAASIGAKKAYFDVLTLLERNNFQRYCKGGYEFCKLIFHVHLSLLNNRNSFCQVGNLLYQGSNNFKNHSELAIYFYKKGGIKNDPECLHSLAYVYENDRGSLRNISQALNHYEEIITLVYQKEISFNHFWPATLSKYKLIVKEFVFNLIEKFEL